MSAGPSTIRIMTVDDHPLLRQGIAALLAGQPDMEVVAEASSSRLTLPRERWICILMLQNISHATGPEKLACCSTQRTAHHIFTEI